MDMENSEKPLVSVLMTTYNREKYLAQAIESVLASTYPYFELLVVDDQSKDRSLEIAREYQARDPRVKSILNEKPGRLSKPKQGSESGKRQIPQVCGCR